MNQTNITAGTVARTACLFLALVNQALTMIGKPVLPIADETVNQLITLGATVAAALAAWWKNNSFTDAAQRGDAVMREIRGKGHGD